MVFTDGSTGSGVTEAEEGDPDVELGKGKVAAAVDETEAVKKQSPTIHKWFSETILPRQAATEMKTISHDDFHQILRALTESETAWKSVVAQLDTVCVQDEWNGKTLLDCMGSTNGGLTVYLLAAGVRVTDPTHAWYLVYSAFCTAAKFGDLTTCKILSEYVPHFGRDELLFPRLLGNFEVVGYLITHPKYDRQWDNELFSHLCERCPQLVVPYLDLFAVEVPPQTYAYLETMNRSPVTDYNSRSGVKYHQLKQVYGDSTTSVPETPLAVAMKSSVAREALACKVMRHIIKAKWMAFGQTMFRQEAFLYTTLVLAFSTSIVCNQVTTPWHEFHGTRELVVGISRILAAVFSAVLLVRVERREAIVEGVEYFLSFWNVLGAGTYVGIIFIVFYQASGADSEALHVSTGVLNITLWVNMYQYLQMSRHFAVLVAMMSLMVGDVVKFILLYSMFLLGFSGGFYVVLFDSSGFETFVDALITVQLMLFGQINYDPFKAATGLTWTVANLLLLVYLVSVVIVLLNLLIAMMSTTYDNVWDEAEIQVLLSYAQIIVRMEQSIMKADREKQVERLSVDAEDLKRKRARAVSRTEALPRARRSASKGTADLFNSSQILLVWRVLGAVCVVILHLHVLFLHLRGGLAEESASPLAWDVITDCSTLQDGERWEVEQKQTDSDKQAALYARVEKLTSLVETTLAKEPSTDGDQHAALTTRVDKLTSLVELQTALINDSSVDKLTAHIAQLTTWVETLVGESSTYNGQQTALTARVDTLTSLVRTQTALIKDPSNSMHADDATVASVVVVKDEVVALSTRVDHFTILVEQQTALIKEQSDTIRVLASLLRAGTEAEG